MDLTENIRNLIAEKEKLDKVIEALQDLRDYKAPKRAGRRFMGEEERQEVSARMKRYWAKRRREKTGSS